MGSVPPPTSTPSGLAVHVSPMRPGAASGRVITMCWVRLLPPQIRVATATHSYGSALLSGPVRAGILEHAARSDYAARTAQVIGLGCFRTTRRHGHRLARYMKGPPQVRLGSMRGQRNGRGRPCEPALAQPAVPAWQRKGPATAQPAPFCPSRAVPRVRTLWAMRGQTAGSPIIFAGLEETAGPSKSTRSGSVNRSSCPDSVRYMSVTTAMQGRTAAHRETQRDKSKAARVPGYAQATGRFRRWWQVLGSNQRRLSRRFYREPPARHRNAPELR